MHFKTLHTKRFKIVIFTTRDFIRSRTFKYINIIKQIIELKNGHELRSTINSVYYFYFRSNKQNLLLYILVYACFFNSIFAYIICLDLTYITNEYQVCKYETGFF